MEPLLVDANTIPTWLVSVTMIITGVFWFITRNASIRMDSRIFALTFILWGVMYGVLFSGLFGFPFIAIGVRIFYLKLMLVMICFSQYVPLLISYIRSIKRSEHK